MFGLLIYSAQPHMSGISEHHQKHRCQQLAASDFWLLRGHFSLGSPPVKGLKFTIEQYRISYLLATSGPGTKFLPNSVTVKVREAVWFLMLDGSCV